MARRSQATPAIPAEKHLELVLAVEGLTEQVRRDRVILEEIRAMMDDYHDGMQLSLSTNCRSQPNISTTFEEAAAKMDRKRVNGTMVGDVTQHQGSLFS